MYAVILFLFGFLASRVDNWAHFGGFVGGYASAVLLDPLKPERLDHLIAAFICLGATGLAVVYSVLRGLPYVQ